ncbi:unnamed protein product [Vicia faba]|uniref:Uncharacterized protein n=1 Tax=Vicia faba TaxID=3906 RepID=A0AAV0YYJ1_VICFA|nr:unnamed protein product [Vicia faba]
MSNNNLVGTIPYQLPPNLQRLNFAHNNLTGTLPYSISNLTSLTHLNLNHNQLQQPLNLNFLNLSTLSKLDLSFNSLTGDLPPTMSSLSGITTMYLQNNQFTGTIDILANLTLNSLNVENNNFTGWILERLKNIDDLQTGDRHCISSRVNLRLTTGNQRLAPLCFPPHFPFSNNTSSLRPHIRAATFDRLLQLPPQIDLHRTAPRHPQPSPRRNLGRYRPSCLVLEILGFGVVLQREEK